VQDAIKRDALSKQIVGAGRQSKTRACAIGRPEEGDDKAIDKSRGADTEADPIAVDQSQRSHT
jgi:hypothetical protein